MRHLLTDDELQEVLLCHPIISQDQQAVAALQQASKQLQAVIAQLLPGMLPVTLHVMRCVQVQSFGLWLRKHGGLLRELAVHVAGSKASRPPITFDRLWNTLAPTFASPLLFKRLQDTTRTELEHALQQAAASGVLQLQSFSLAGASATCSSMDLGSLNWGSMGLGSVDLGSIDWGSMGLSSMDLGSMGFPLSGASVTCSSVGRACLWHSLPAASLTRLCAQVGDIGFLYGASLQAIADLRLAQLAAQQRNARGHTNRLAGTNRVEAADTAVCQPH
jgi:hypothetical protein